MKKIIICLIATIALGFLATKTTMAGPGPSKTLGTGASITDSAPELDIAVLKFDGITPNLNNPWTTPGVQILTGTPNLAFGQLVHTYLDNSGNTKDAGVWYSKVVYMVSVYASGFGKRYQITSTCAGLGSIPASAFVLTPVYADGDRYQYPDGTFSPAQGPLRSGASVGSAGSAVGTNKLIYQSETPGTAAILQSWYSIPTKKADGSDPYSGWVGIPLTQTPGNYSGNVVISISAI
ncbi:MAG: hypothetical protein NT033_01920 [Candidatus Omnitrophica bacterium]|nr:hypothetical protein [Candidatus Omnitrophota bacterium]